MVAWSPTDSNSVGVLRANLNPSRRPTAALPDQQADGVGPHRWEQIGRGLPMCPLCRQHLARLFMAADEVKTETRKRTAEWPQPGNNWPPGGHDLFAPYLAQGGEAIRSEAWIAVDAHILRRSKATECIEGEAVCFVAHPSWGATIADMNNIISSQVPKHFNRAGIEDCLRNILSNQQTMATTFWEAFQSLGYRLDKHDIAFEAVRDRLWKVEHPLAEKLLKEALGLSGEVK